MVARGLQDEKWVAGLRRGRRSDALLSCPACLTTVCVDCQQHAQDERVFRAMFVLNCRLALRDLPSPFLFSCLILLASASVVQTTKTPLLCN